jgi:integrase
MRTGKWRGKKMINGLVKTKVFPTKQDAKKWEAAQDASLWEAESSPTRTTCLGELANLYLDMSKQMFSANSYIDKRWAFRQVFRYISPEQDITGITPAMVQGMMLKLAQVHSSGNVVNRVRKHASAAWVWGKKYFSLPPLNPFHETQKLPEDRHPRYVPPEADFWKMYAEARPDDQVLFLALLHTGARRGEMFRLKWEDVDFSNRAIRLGTRKTGHGGMEYALVPMTDELHAELSQYKMRRRASDLEYVFSNSSGQPHTRRPYFMKRLCRIAGVKPFGFHAIRHLAATILAHGGLDLPTVQSMLRHKHITTTSRYIQSLGVQPEKVNRVFAGRRPPRVIPFPKKAIGT